MKERPNFNVIIPTSSNLAKSLAETADTLLDVLIVVNFCTFMFNVRLSPGFRNGDRGTTDVAK